MGVIYNVDKEYEVRLARATRTARVMQCFIEVPYINICI